MTTDERLKKLLNASPKQLEAIDELLEGRTIDPLPTTQGPLLMGMSASAEFLGVLLVFVQAVSHCSRGFTEGDATQHKCQKLNKNGPQTHV
jgi:hypothetical protein